MVPLSDWLSALRDIQAKTAIRRRIDRVGAGNRGSASSLRSGLGELKIDMGLGYRVYWALHGKTIVLLFVVGTMGLLTGIQSDPAYFRFVVETGHSPI